MMTKIIENQKINCVSKDSSNDNCFPDSSLNKGRPAYTSKMDTAKDRKQIIDDSQKNCRIICCLLPPVIFLTPTSFALFNELAILILIKLIPAIIKIKIDIP